MPEMMRLYQKSEYHYPCTGEFLPGIAAYLHEDAKPRPAMLVVPGGGYSMVSPTEGEIVAKRFFDAGYQAFVLTYTTNMFRLAPLNRQPLEDIARAVCCIRRRSGEWHIRPDQIVCCGFSAGGHLVGSLAVHYQELPDPDASRPNAVLLCYPVITSGQKSHQESFHTLLGENATREQLDWASLERHVTKDTPPAFLWQTLTDELVPVENSILYANACRSSEVPCELHLFMDGAHGLSLANADWAAGNFGATSLYTMEQPWQTLRALYQTDPSAIPEVFFPAARAETLLNFVEEWTQATAAYQSNTPGSANPSVEQWPSLALAWLEKILG